MQYVTKIRLQLKDFKGKNDPAIWPWFERHFNLKYKWGDDKSVEASKALLKLQMRKGNVEGYIKQFKVLRKSAGWSEDKQGTFSNFDASLDWHTTVKSTMQK